MHLNNFSEKESIGFTSLSKGSMVVFLNRRAAARNRALASIIPGRERPEETKICYKISLVQ